MKKAISVGLFLIFVLFSAGCSNSKPEDNRSNNEQLLATISVDTINAVLTNADIKANYDVQAYKITYQTQDPNGKNITASGLVAIPVKPAGKPSPILSYQHGTIYHNSQAPSFHYQATDVFIMAAGLGFITVAPDYIGYGSSVGTLHPYVQADSLGLTGVDMLRAARDMLARQNIATNGQLFLAGYSEGGYATMALHKTIEQHYSNEFSVTASAPGAGSYDMLSSALYWANTEQLLSPALAAFLVKAYDHYYEMNALDQIIAEPYVDVVDGLFTGLLFGNQINEQLTYNTRELFRTEFLDSFVAGGQQQMRQLLEQNNLYSWSPAAPIRLYHGPDDQL